MSSRIPVIRLKPREQKRVLAGHPWIYSNELVMDAAAKTLAPGSVVTVQADDGRALGTAMFNPHTLIAARMLDRMADVEIGADWIAERLHHALRLRERLFTTPFYRLVHAEADRLPGLVVDRYGDVLAVEINTAGMARLEGEIETALGELVTPRALVFASASAARTLEGLAPETRVARGLLDTPVEVAENGVRYLADLLGGQKTGWFYDQRANRRFMASIAQGASVLDVYSYTGGFALACAAGGARDVLAIDRSAAASALAQEAARRNGLDGTCRFETAEAFEALSALARRGERFEIVIVDPPAFAKSRKDIPAALKGYRKLARMAAEVTAENGFLFVASCSHHVATDALLAEVRHGLADARRFARLVRQAGAGPDHPIHPALPESAYLKTLVFAF